MTCDIYLNPHPVVKNIIYYQRYIAPSLFAPTTMHVIHIDAPLTPPKYPEHTESIHRYLA